MTEYIYWGLTSVLDGQNFPGREGEISEEWKLNTLEKIRNSDPALYAILSNPNFVFPTALPDGSYQAASLPLDKNGDPTPPDSDDESENDEEREDEWDDEEDWDNEDEEGDWDDEDEEDDWGDEPFDY